MGGKPIRATKSSSKTPALGKDKRPWQLSTLIAFNGFTPFANFLPMGYRLAMKSKLRFVGAGMIFLFVAANGLLADVVEMQNGDRYFGTVLSVSADAVVLKSDVLGKITLPRKNVSGLAFGTNAVALPATANLAPAVTSTNLPAAAPTTPLVNTNVDLSAALRNLGADTNFVGQIRQQMLAGSPEAASKYDAMVNGLLSGQLNLNDVRREAQSSADQLRELKKELGPDADDSLDGYLQVLDQFLNETADQPANTAPTPPAKPAVR